MSELGGLENTSISEPILQEGVIRDDTAPNLQTEEVSVEQKYTKAINAEIAETTDAVKWLVGSLAISGATGALTALEFANRLPVENANPLFTISFAALSLSSLGASIASAMGVRQSIVQEKKLMRDKLHYIADKELAGQENIQ